MNEAQSRLIGVVLTALRPTEGGFEAELRGFKKNRYRVQLTREELLDHASFVRIVHKHTRKTFFYVTRDNSEWWESYFRLGLILNQTEEKCNDFNELQTHKGASDLYLSQIPDRAFPHPFTKVDKA